MRTVIILDCYQCDMESLSESRKFIDIILLDKLIFEGERNPINISNIPSDSIYCLCYTSGTTGTPKGALIS